MTIKDALKKYSNLETELLLSCVLGKSKEFLFMAPGRKLSSFQVKSLSSMVKRREKAEPIAYILGYKDFCGLRFKVDRNVLIPRPETEQIVESVKLKVESLRQKNIRVLDVGTGSGCIIVSLAHMWATRMTLAPRKGHPCVEFYASDISHQALKVAKQNAKVHFHTRLYEGKKIKFIQSDLLEKVRVEPDIIIANLPYGWRGVRNRFSSVKDGLRFEPQGALYAGEKGLGLIKKLLVQIAARKKQPKFIYLEFDPRQKKALAVIIKKYLPKAGAEFHKDFNNMWRYAEIKTD